MSASNLTVTAIHGKPAIAIDFAELPIWGGIVNGQCRDMVSTASDPVDQMEELADFYYCNMPVARVSAQDMRDIQAVVDFLN